MYFTLAWSLLAAAVAGGELTSSGRGGLYDVADQRQLLIDEAFFDQASNVRLRLHPARKTGETILCAPMALGVGHSQLVQRDAGPGRGRPAGQVPHVVRVLRRGRMVHRRRHLVLLQRIARRHPLEQAVPRAFRIPREREEQYFVSPDRPVGRPLAGARHRGVSRSHGPAPGPLQGRFAGHLARPHAAAPDCGHVLARRAALDPLRETDLRRVCRQPVFGLLGPTAGEVRALRPRQRAASGGRKATVFRGSRRCGSCSIPIVAIRRDRASTTRLP